MSDRKADPFWDALLLKYSRVYDPAANARALAEKQAAGMRAAMFNDMFPDSKSEKR